MTDTFVLPTRLKCLASVTPAGIIENTQIFDFELTAEDMTTISGYPKKHPPTQQFN